MAKNTKKQKKVTVKEIRQQIIEKMAETDPTTAQYKALVENLKTLEMAERIGDPKVSKADWLKIAVSLGVPIGLLIYESRNPISTKIVGLLPKFKL